MIRLLSALVLVHGALWVWADKPKLLELSPDPNDQCRMTTGDDQFGKDYPIMGKRKIDGKMHWWKLSEPFFVMPTKMFEFYPSPIRFIEVIDHECCRSGPKKENFASTKIVGEDQKWVAINFNRRFRKTYSFEIIIRS